MRARKDNGGRHAAALADLAGRLTTRDRELARLLAEHQVLTTDQCEALLGASPVTLGHRLVELARLQVVDRFRPLTQVGAGSAPYHYVLGQAGAAVLAAEQGLDPAALGYRRDQALAVAHSGRLLAHLVGVNGFFAALAQAARTRPSARLVCFRPAARCAERWARSCGPTPTGAGPSPPARSTSSSSTTPATARPRGWPPSSPATTTSRWAAASPPRSWSGRRPPNGRLRCVACHLPRWRPWPPASRRSAAQPTRCGSRSAGPGHAERLRRSPTPTPGSPTASHARRPPARSATPPALPRRHRRASPALRRCRLGKPGQACHARRPADHPGRRASGTDHLDDQHPAKAWQALNGDRTNK
jgi:Replication-relaxation